MIMGNSQIPDRRTLQLPAGTSPWGQTRNRVLISDAPQEQARWAIDPETGTHRKVPGAPRDRSRATGRSRTTTVGRTRAPARMRRTTQPAPESFYAEPGVVLPYKEMLSTTVTV